jgi:hypothetical protein
MIEADLLNIVKCTMLVAFGEMVPPENVKHFLQGVFSQYGVTDAATARDYINNASGELHE